MAYCGKEIKEAPAEGQAISAKCVGKTFFPIFFFFFFQIPNPHTHTFNRRGHCAGASQATHRCRASSLDNYNNKKRRKKKEKRKKTVTNFFSPPFFFLPQLQLLPKLSPNSA